MKSSTYLIRLTRLLVLGVFVAGTAASVAGAYEGRPPDVQEAATAAHTTPAGLKADGLRWQGIAQVYKQQQVPTPRQVLDAVKQTSPNQVGLAWQYLRDTGQIAAAYDGRPLDVQDAATALHSTPAGLKADGLRWQGIATVYRQSQVGQAAESGSLSQSSGFDWADYAIGIGSGMGLILALAGGLAIAWQRRHRVQTA